jgi:hypothetical protein
MIVYVNEKLAIHPMSARPSWALTKIRDALAKVISRQHHEKAKLVHFKHDLEKFCDQITTNDTGHGLHIDQEPINVLLETIKSLANQKEKTINIRDVEQVVDNAIVNKMIHDIAGARNDQQINQTVDAVISK